MIRREFLRLSSGALALSVAGLTLPFGVSTEDRKRQGIYKVLVDKSSADAIAFGNKMARLGYSVHHAGRDITSIWHDDIRVELTARPAVIAGLTSFGTFSLIEQVARDQWMRVAFEGMHAVASDEHINHLLNGPVSMVNNFKAGIGDYNWVDSLVMAVTGIKAIDGRHQILTDSAVSKGALEGDLVSWVIAPVKLGQLS